MNKEDKSLLLKDLCARLPYGFKLYRKSDDCIITIKPGDISTFAHFLEYSESDDFKPYLRPMSSMSKEERALYFAIDEDPVTCIDWLNTHYFDYRGLIEKCLALESPEGIKTE